MTTKENFALYKKRIKNEISSLDEDQRDEYFMAEWDYYIENYSSDFPNSIEEMKDLLEFDRVLLIVKAQIEQERITKKAEKKQKQKEAKDEWKSLPIYAKLISIVLWACIPLAVFVLL